MGIPRGRRDICTQVHCSRCGGASKSWRTVSHVIPAACSLPTASWCSAFLLEGVSLRRGLSQAGEDGSARLAPRHAFVRLTSDTTLKAVIFEDRATLAGLGIAATGLALWQATGRAAWDGAASRTIGLLLAVVAVDLAHANLSLLIGQRVSPQLEMTLQAGSKASPASTRFPFSLSSCSVPARSSSLRRSASPTTRPRPRSSRVADEAEARLRIRFPAVRYVF